MPEALLHYHAASSLGSRARLFAAIVRMKRERTRSMPRYTVWAIPETFFAQPKASSIRLRCLMDKA